MSSAILSFALAVTLEALIKEQSGMWEGVPTSASILIFFVPGKSPEELLWTNQYILYFGISWQGRNLEIYDPWD